MTEKQLNKLRKRAWKNRNRWVFTFSLTMGSSSKVLSPYDIVFWEQARERIKEDNQAIWKT